MIALMIGYLNIGAVLLAATAGENAPSYIGGYCFILMLSIFAPSKLKNKIILSSISFFLFFAIGILTGLPFSQTAIRYSINDMVIAFLINIMLSYILNKIKRTSWQRQQKFMELIDETMEAASEAKAASKSKSDFLAKMSHEIRTPMNAITGMAELAMRESTLEAAKEHVFTIKHAGANLLSIINDILDFSKIESGKMELVPTDYSFSSLVNDVVSITRMKMMDSGVDFVVNIDSSIPDALCGDETRIRQVLLNVLNNAAK
jgi:signal transduction histidine kinase